MNVELLVAIPEWLYEKLSAIAEICGESIDHVAASFFAAEVVHTQQNQKSFSCP